MGLRIYTKSLKKIFWNTKMSWILFHLICTFDHFIIILSCFVLNLLEIVKTYLIDDPLLLYRCYRHGDPKYHARFNISHVEPSFILLCHMDFNADFGHSLVLWYMALSNMSNLQWFMYTSRAFLVFMDNSLQGRWVSPLPSQCLGWCLMCNIF